MQPIWKANRITLKRKNQLLYLATKARITDRMLALADERIKINTQTVEV